PDLINIDYLGDILIELLKDTQKNGLEFYFCYKITINDHCSTKKITSDIVKLIKEIDKYS
ncbi:11689_t:CDS:1, partial [Dentiscutata heterogama]